MHHWEDIGPPPPLKEMSTSRRGIDGQLALQVAAYAQSNPSFAREVSNRGDSAHGGLGSQLGRLLSAEALSGHWKAKKKTAGDVDEQRKDDELREPSWERWYTESREKLTREKNTRILKRELRAILIKSDQKLPSEWDDDEDFVTTDLEDDEAVALEEAMASHLKMQRDRFRKLGGKLPRAKVVRSYRPIPSLWLGLEHQSDNSREVSIRLMSWRLPRVE